MQLAHTHWTAKSGSDLEAEALRALLHGNQTLRHSLKKFGVQLGYHYPEDNPWGQGGGGGGSARKAAVVDGNGQSQPTVSSARGTRGASPACCATSRAKRRV